MSMQSHKRIEFIALFIALACFTALIFGVATRRSSDIVEAAAPAERMESGALRLHRDPEPPAADAPATPEIRMGERLERRARVVVNPRKPGPVRTDLALIEQPDGGRRVVASSPDGDVIGGIDVPARKLIIPESRKWAAGLSASPTGKRPGVWIDRDVGRVRLGIELQPDGARIRAGITF